MTLYYANECTQYARFVLALTHYIGLALYALNFIYIALANTDKNISHIAYHTQMHTRTHAHTHTRTHAH